MSGDGPKYSEVERMTARNRARHAVSVAAADRPIAAGLLLKRRDLEVLLAFTDAQAADVEHRCAVAARSI